MTGPLLALAVAATGVGCGNYSNEDLEFMNALPEQSDLSADVPARGAVVLANTAEFYRMTRDVEAIFNGIVDAFLSLVDGIRAYPPTTRHPNERIWGPVPAEHQPGWLIRMVVDRADVTTFNYRIELQSADNPDDQWSSPAVLMTGMYDAAGGVRRGVGHLSVDTSPLRSLGVDPGLGFLDTLTIDYTTSSFPIDVKLTFTNLPNPLKPDDPTQGTYEYGADANGLGALSYDFFGNSIPGPLVDELLVTSRWLDTGEGRADLQVVSGDAAGASATECWNGQFEAVYIDKAWAPLENLGAVSDCAAIPTL